MLNNPSANIDDKNSALSIRPLAPIVQNINVNVTNQVNGNDILVKYNNQEQKFTIYDKNKNLLGSVSIVQFIKYLVFDISKTFLREYDHEAAVNLIEKYFARRDAGTNKITLLSHLESPIMGNLGKVLELYSGIHTFEMSSMKNEFEKTNESKESKEVLTAIQNRIKDIVYLVLNHALKLIVNIAEVIKNDSSKNDLKSSLTRYSIIIINKINQLIKESIDTKVYGAKNLEIQIIQFDKIKKETDKKMTAFEETIKFQNEKIKRILDYIDVRENDVLEKEDINEYVSDTASNASSDTGSDTASVAASVTGNDSQSRASSFTGVNENFNDADYGYAESNTDHAKIAYLTPDADKDPRPF